MLQESEVEKGYQNPRNFLKVEKPTTLPDDVSSQVDKEYWKNLKELRRNDGAHSTLANQVVGAEAH